jgi:AbiV family abortive infection protein
LEDPKTPKLTADLLRAYSEAALANAQDLLAEATLLRDHDHMARAYFLAVSSIEEAGKALQAFDFQKRNLSDPAVCSKLISGLESHGQKINYAMSTWGMSDPDARAGLKAALDLIGHLKRGREPSMYSDIHTDPDRAETPREIVRPEAARDCVRLAENCVAHARRHLAEKAPPEFTPAQDRLFTMKSAKFQEMLNQQDFWEHYLSRLDEGNHDIADAVKEYQHQVAKAAKPRDPRAE